MPTLVAKCYDQMLCAANGIPITTFNICRAVTDTFIEHNVTGACLATSSLCVEMLNKCGIDATLRIGWALLRQRVKPRRVIRHVWVQSAGKHIDPAGDIALILYNAPKMKLVYELPDDAIVFAGVTPEEIRASVEFEQSIQVFQNTPNGLVEYWKSAPESLQALREKAAQAALSSF